MAKVKYNKFTVYFKPSSPSEMELLEWAKKTADFRGESLGKLFKDGLRLLRRKLSA